MGKEVVAMARFDEDRWHRRVEVVAAVVVALATTLAAVLQYVR